MFIHINPMYNMKNKFMYGPLFYPFLFYPPANQGKPKLLQWNPDNKWIEEITITELQQGYKDSKFSVSDVVSAYLSQD